MRAPTTSYNARPRFSQVLLRRRQELRLTTNQASRNLRLKEEVLIAFEDGDWSRIPRSGYAQGMLSSYARYLGLNPSEIILLFQEDFEAYTRGHAYSSEEPFEQTPQASIRLPQTKAAQDRALTSPPPFSAKRAGDLYGSQGPAGSMLSGSLEEQKLYGRERRSISAFAKTDAPGYGYAQKYLTQPASAVPEDSSYTHRNLYTRHSSETLRKNRRTRTAPIRDSSVTAAFDQIDVAPQTAYQTGEIRTRPIKAQMFSDDLHYDPARPYQQASSAKGRQASRNIAKPERPNVQRRASRAQAFSAPAAARSDEKRAETFFSDPKRAMLVAFLLVAAVLLVLITLGIRSCASKMDTNNQPALIANPEQNQESSDETLPAPANTQYVEVKVEVMAGDVTWLEIKNDALSDVAQTITGPWSKTYQVTGTMQIKAADASAVSISANGKAVSFTKSSAGLSVATINAADYGVTAAATNAPAGDATNADAAQKSADKTNNEKKNTADANATNESAKSKAKNTKK